MTMETKIISLPVSFTVTEINEAAGGPDLRKDLEREISKRLAEHRRVCPGPTCLACRPFPGFA